MIKKIFLILIISTVFIFNTSVYSSLDDKNNLPELNCVGLPGCKNVDTMDTSKEVTAGNIGIDVISNLIGQIIQFVAVFAVIALILSGMLLLFSGGDEEKTKKAKSWIIWSLVGVFLSISAWGIINMLNKITIG